MVPHPPGRCICRLCKTIGHTATECPWLEEAKATTKPPETKIEDEEPEVLFCLHCRSETHRIEDCTAYKVAQAKRKKVWCEKCKQYGHTMADCLDEKKEQRNREIEREILKRKQQLEEIDRKMHQVKRQAEKDIGKPPQDRDTRDYPVGGRKPVTKPKKSDREPETTTPKGRSTLRPTSRSWEEEENPQREMTQVNLMTLIQMKVMKRNQMIQRLQKNQVSCMMKREEK